MGQRSERFRAGRGPCRLRGEPRAGGAAGHRDESTRPGVGRLDAPDPPLKLEHAPRLPRIALFALLLLAWTSRAHAHVGSPDIVHEGMAGPYRILVSVIPPQVIPGVAEVEVDGLDPGVQGVKLVPMPLQGGWRIDSPPLPM